jgi:hypothetical protein
MKETCSSEDEPQIWRGGFGINAISLIAFLDGERETNVCTVDSPEVL